MTDNYVDVRALMDNYKTVPCRYDDCDEEIYASIAFRPDSWYCRAHTPARVNMEHLRDDVVVRL